MLQTPTWPTESGLLEADVRQQCTEEFANSIAVQKCTVAINETFDNFIDDCIDDIGVRMFVEMNKENGTGFYLF